MRGRSVVRRVAPGLAAALVLATMVMPQAGAAESGRPGSGATDHADAATAATEPNAEPDRPDGPEQGVQAVAATDEAIQVSGTGPAEETVDVYALGTEEDPESWTDADPVASVDADASGDFEVQIGRDGGERRLYYAKYLTVADGQMVGRYRYAHDIDITPTHEYSYPTSPTKKGLQVQMTADAEELGVGHASLNVALDELMQRDDAGGDETMTFTSNGREFYFDRAAVESLDRQIKPLSENGQVVNLILLLYQNDDPNSAFEVLAHPDFDPEGTVVGFNTQTAEGVAHYTAAVEFITDRWTRADGRHGQATGFIVGNEVDAQWVWSQCRLVKGCGAVVGSGGWPGGHYG